MTAPSNTPQPPAHPHRKALLALGFILSQLIGFFVGAFIFIPLWFNNLENGEGALLLLGVIFLVTLIAAVASYFWSLAGLPLGTIRLLAVPNGALLWFYGVLHPALGGDLFFSIFDGAIIIICSMLGSWFGRRVFYE